jgi:hypothetical protein
MDGGKRPTRTPAGPWKGRTVPPDTPLYMPKIVTATFLSCRSAGPLPMDRPRRTVVRQQALTSLPGCGAACTLEHNAVSDAHPARLQGTGAAHDSRRLPLADSFGKRKEPGRDRSRPGSLRMAGSYRGGVCWAKAISPEGELQSAARAGVCEVQAAICANDVGRRRLAAGPVGSSLLQAAPPRHDATVWNAPARTLRDS